jgi:hypothetical protein
MRWLRWFRHYAISRQVAGSIPYGVTDLILPAALWIWDRLSLSDKFVPAVSPGWAGGQGGWCVMVTTLSPSCVDSLEILGSLLPAAQRPYPGLKSDRFTFSCTRLHVLPELFATFSGVPHRHTEFQCGSLQLPEMKKSRTIVATSDPWRRAYFIHLFFLPLTSNLHYLSPSRRVPTSCLQSDRQRAC